MVEKNKQKRLSILGEDEFKAIFARPHLTDEEHGDYFSLSQPEKELMQGLRSVNSRVHFILQLGYFKAKHQFFTFDLRDVKNDFQYILKQHFPDSRVTNLHSIDKSTRLKQQQLILELFHYRQCGAKEREHIEKKARQAVTVSSKPIFVFREIMNDLAEQRIVSPGYSFIQEAVSQAITFEQHRLIGIVQHHLKQVDIDALKALLEDTQGLYEITKLKREPKDFSLKEIKQEIQRGQQIQSLYQRARTLIPQLGISNESIKYYASLVDYYSVFRIKRLDERLVYIYLICFVFFRYQRMNDNLINTFIYNVRRYADEAKTMAKERIYERYTENRQNMQKVGDVLRLFTDDNIAKETPFGDIREKAFAILERQKLDNVAEQITSNAKWDETAIQWEYIDRIERQFKRHLRLLFRMIDFAAPSMSDPLMKAIYFVKEALDKNKSLGQYATDRLPHQFLRMSIKK
ncbi:DUF4158 domain-containing protein [Virgibacillus sp. DJP39]|uniref:DUF4158 domain-containing protein n=1 Tax=Virgibacillus sp. DJP39 TaxID=3409790 RepID=UPI003BB55670